MYRLIAFAAFALLPVSHALASSDDAWANFAIEVEQGCLDATKDVLGDAKAVVDPFGSESYGLAVVSGTSADHGTASIICVFDKRSKAVEIGGELELPTPAGTTRR